MLAPTTVIRLTCNINCQILLLANFVLASKEQIVAEVWQFAYILLLEYKVTKPLQHCMK
jgi:hypothetical protein